MLIMRTAVAVEVAAAAVLVPVTPRGLASIAELSELLSGAVALPVLRYNHNNFNPLTCCFVVDFYYSRSVHRIAKSNDRFVLELSYNQ